MSFLIKFIELFTMFTYYVLAKVLISIYVESMLSGVVFIVIYSLFIFISIAYIIHKLPENISKYL